MTGPPEIPGEERDLKYWKGQAEDADACLKMVRDRLVDLGIEMEKCPPMCYDDAIRTLYFRTAKAAANCQKEHKSHDEEPKAWGDCVRAGVLAQTLETRMKK